MKENFKQQVFSILSKGYNTELSNKDLALALVQTIDAPLSTLQRAVSDFKRNYRKPTRNVLVIPDLHIGAEHEDALEFCKWAYEKYNCNEVVVMGDEVDYHAMSFHQTDPDLPNSGDEYELAKIEMQRWGKAFPGATCIQGNHHLPIRKAAYANIPKSMLKSREELYDNSWTFVVDHNINDWLFTHMGNPKTLSKDWDKNVIVGHYHSKREAVYVDNKWAIWSGCLVNENHLAMAYGKGGKRMKLGVVVIEDMDGKHPKPIMVDLPEYYENL